MFSLLNIKNDLEHKNDFQGRFLYLSSALLLPRRHPDILDLSRLVQELVTFALLAVEPIAGQTVACPCALHVRSGLVLDVVTAFRRAEVPERVHVFVLDEGLDQMVTVTCDDVDHAARHI